MKVKGIGFIGIPVTDMGNSRRFYEGILGLEKAAEFMNGRWIEYTAGGDTVALANISDTWKPSDQGTAAAFEVEDFNDAIWRLKDAKVQFAAEAFETPNCFMAVVQDPDGNKLIIHKLKLKNESEQSYD